VATRTDAARAEVVAAREAFAAEYSQLGPATRAAVDVPAKIRRAPVQSAALAGGAAFLVLGGPRRVLGRLRRVVRGQPAALPSSMLPDDIEKALRKLGSDGDAVRGALENSFADYLDQRGSFAQRSVRTASSEVTASTIKLLGRLIGIQLTRRLLAGAGPMPSIRGRIVQAEKAEFAAAVDEAHERVARKAEAGDEPPRA
jgi:hypothetical protein